MTEYDKMKEVATLLKKPKIRQINKKRPPIRTVCSKPNLVWTFLVGPDDKGDQPQATAEVPLIDRNPAVFADQLAPIRWVIQATSWYTIVSITFRAAWVAVATTSATTASVNVRVDLLQLLVVMVVGMLVRKWITTVIHAGI